MRADKPDIDALTAIVDSSNQPIFVPPDIKDDSTGTDDIRAPEDALYIGRLCPLRSADDMNPGAKRLLRIAATGTSPEFPQRANRNNPHLRDRPAQFPQP
jgi:hypothetical protein